MPRLSLYRSNRQNDYRFLDRTISEMYTVGGLDIYVHKYLGPKVTGDSAEGPGDATQPTYSTTDPLLIEDLFLLENRDRAYDADIYRMRGVYNQQDIDFDLTQFGLFLNNDTLFITFHYNDMIDILGRKLMNGDVLELPNLRDFHPLNPNVPTAIPKFYVIQDAAFASEGFSQTWLPHLWRVKASPMVSGQEYNDILNKPMDKENPGSGTLDQWMGTRVKDYQINDAILEQAEAEVPLSGYDTTKFYIYPTNEDGSPANPLGTTVDSSAITSDDTNLDSDTAAVSPRANGYTMGYLTGDGIAPNGLPVTPGVSFPLNPREGDYALRLDYFPNRLFRYTGSRWVKIEDSVRTELTPGTANQTQRSRFVNNSATVPTTDRGPIPSRQSLSDALKPEADN
jgi:hypothetical protein